jgi:Xaa-Pro aminopeptidase
MRLSRLRQLMQEKGLGSLLISRPSNRRYLSGFKADDPQEGESAGMLFISQDKAFLVTDPRYADLAKEEVKEFEVFVYKGNFFEQINEVLKQMPSPLGFEAMHLSYGLYERFSQTIEKNRLSLTLTPTEYLVEGLREIKDEDEISLLKEALRLTEKLFLWLKNYLKPGLTEKEVAWQIEAFIKHDLKAELSFPPIVASGPNAAIPHAVPTAKKIQAHEPIIVDCGVKWEGYCADMTRTFYIGTPDEEYKKVYNLVLGAQQKGMKAIRAGITAYEVDAAAREFLKDNGCAEAFLHSLGHGVGLLVHEPPSLSPRRPSKVLKANMVVTMEPGLYFSGWGGVRIEDMVLVKKNGGERLNQLSAILDDWVL